MIKGEIRILKEVIEAVVHKITVSSIEIDGVYSTVYTCNTLYLNTGKVLTIDNVKYRVTEFVINEYFTLKAIKGTSTLDTSITEITIPNPKFYDGTPRRVQAENLNDKKVPGYQSPIIWLLMWLEIKGAEDKNSSYITSTIQGANLFFLDDCKSNDWNQEDHRIEVLEPMENEMWHIFRALEARQDIFDKDIQEPDRRPHANFGEYLTNKGYDQTILTGSWSGIQAILDIPFIIDLCDCDKVEVCKPVRFLLDGVKVEDIQSGGDINIIVENQDGDTPTYEFDTDTDILTVQTGGGSTPVDITINGAPFLEDQTSNVNISIIDTVGSGVGAITGATEITIDDATVTNSNATYTNAVEAEGTIILPDTNVEVFIDMVSQGTSSVVTLDPIAEINIIWI